jgi:hypothetical protein
MTAEAVLSIWDRAIPGGGGLPPEAAREFLRMQFAEGDRTRAAELSARASAGTLTDDQRAELEAFTHAAALLAVLHSEARLALRVAGGGGHGVPAA